MNSRVHPSALVTGAHGFIGRHVARRLKDGGYEVTGIGHGKWEAGEAERFGVQRWRQADVTVEELRALDVTPSIIVHCAGSGLVSASLTAPFEDFQRTVGTTMAVLEFMRHNAPEAQFAYPSSAAVYGCVDQLPISEDAPIQPLSPYGVHKQCAEAVCKSYARAHGTKIALVRLFSVFGEGLRKQLWWDACEKFRQRCARFPGSGQELRDFVHVSDAADLLVLAAQSASPAALVINGAAGRGVPVRDVIFAIGAALPGAPAPVFTGQALPGHPNNYVAQVDKAATLGWCPRVEWRTGVDRYVDWYVTQHVARKPCELRGVDRGVSTST